jgi:WD40 repeat protein
MHEARKLHEVTPEGQLRVVRFAPDGKALWGGSYDGRVRRWDLSGETPRELPELTGHHGFVDAMACAPSLRRMFTADSWGRLCAWEPGDTPAVKWQHEAAHDGWIRQMALSPDEKRLATCGRDKIVRIWSAETGERLAELAGHVDEVFAVAFHPDGKALVSADLLANVKHWDLNAGTCARDVRLPKLHYYNRDHDVAGVYALRFIDGGKTLVAAGSNPTGNGFVAGFPHVELVAWDSLTVTKSFTLGTKEDGFVFEVSEHPDGYLVLVTSGAFGVGQVLLLRTAEDKPFFTSKDLVNCHSLALHAESKRVAIVSTNRGSNGNGAVRDKEGKYRPNVSPVTIMEFAAAPSSG